MNARTAPFYSNVSSMYGAPMGRRSSATLTGKVQLQRVPFVDGDYDPGGAYWGGGRDTPPLFCAWDDEGEAVYLRARSSEDAKASLRDDYGVTDVSIVIDDFTEAYIACALWSSTDNSRDGGDPFDQNYSEDDLAPEAIEAIKKDCADFQESHAADLALAYATKGYGGPEQAGHDFWLTRNGHGAGFWDRGIGELGDRLSDASKAYGSCDLYLGDDGKIYIS